MSSYKTISSMFDTARAARAAASDHGTWAERVAALRRRENWSEVENACPITRRNVEKPKGYAGDAVTLDLVHGIGGIPAESDSADRYTQGQND